MLRCNILALVLGAYLANGAPLPSRRAVTTGVTLDQAAVAEAQPHDDTATRAFTAAAIKVSFINSFLFSQELTSFCCRHLMGNACLSTLHRVISARTSHQFK